MSFSIATIWLAVISSHSQTHGLFEASFQTVSPRLKIDQIAYISIDLNNAVAEMATIELLWSKMSPGAIVILDDYAFTGYESQYRAWNNFAKSHNLMLLTVPTGQGILIKPASLTPNP
jgi:O-methyltransferase